MIKRRQFLKRTILFSASSIVLPRLGFAQTAQEPQPYKVLKDLFLTDFCDQQDESPILFGNSLNSWLTTLRRVEYPENREIISLFKLEKGNWKEITPVTPEPGEFEAVAADCAPTGEPLVVWTETRDGHWLIQAARGHDGKFQPADTISDPKRRSINPVVKAVGAHGFVAAWEDYAGGAFSVRLARFQNGHWSPPVQVTPDKASCFEPALAVSDDGTIHLSYSCTDGPHRNIMMTILDEKSLKPGASIPIAIGGGLKDRVNINAKSSMAFDANGRLWISWENNRFTTRLEDSDNYTGDRCCAMACYQDDKLYEQKENGRWLFQGKNDHLPTFHKDGNGNLFVLTHCGGDHQNPHYSFRASYLDPAKGWAKPLTILETKQMGELLRPTILFTENSEAFWLAWKREISRPRCDCHPETVSSEEGQIVVRRGMLEVQQFVAPTIAAAPGKLNLVETVVEEYHPIKGFMPLISGRPRMERAQASYQGENYTLLLGNLHEHSENSSCWPAGTDGTLHDDYRYGLFSEGYDFAGITDHGYTMTEVYWRKSLRMAEFYNDSEHFVALPSVEWTLSNDGDFEIKHGVGHRNIFFSDGEEAKKFIRNSDEVYCRDSPETNDSVKLWNFIHKTKADCVAIPHHPADESHPCDWEVHDQTIEPIVEIFQCRGNAEYRGAPRMINVSRHKPSANDKGFIDYALRDKQYRLGFVASGDHNSMGVGLACLWVKEVSRKGILEAMRARRCFATTGDKIVVDFRLNDVWSGGEAKTEGAPKMSFDIKAVDEISSIDILRNSRVIHTIKPESGLKNISGEWSDANYHDEPGVLYYYLRATQKNNHIAWSSPVWVVT
jgi:hypothetical protein